MSERFPHQEVRLIGITEPNTDNDEFYYEPGRDAHRPDAEDLIAYCARVSNPSNQANFDTAPKLLKYCIRKKHWSIFEMVNVVLEVKTTRDIGRQILRHQFKFQEFSQRYAAVDTDSFVIRECRFQDPKNRQNSISLSAMRDQPYISPEELAGSAGIAQEWKERQRKLHEYIASEYQWALDHNIAKEQARAILPEGGTMSCMYMNGTVRNWMHYSLLRMAEGTQAEHIDVAEKVWNILKDRFEFLNEIEITQ